MRITYALIVLAACGDDGGGGNGDASPGDGNGAAGWSTGTAVAKGPIQETAAVAVAGKIYVIGGLNGQTTVQSVQIYDTATHTWSDGPNLPIAMHHANAATDGTTIYVLGGLNPSFGPLGNVYSLAPATESQWTPRMSMPSGRERGAAVTDIIDGKIYVAGGLRGGASDLLDVYDPGGDSWTPLQAMPATRDHACGAAIGGKLIVAAGRTVSTSSPRPDVWSYDPDMNVWTPRAPMPTGRGGMGCGAIADKLYTTGGEGNPATASGVFADVEVFDPAANTWTELADMPNPKHGVGGAVWNGALYLCGGADKEGLGAIAATDIFKP